MYSGLAETLILTHVSRVHGKLDICCTLYIYLGRRSSMYVGVLFSHLICGHERSIAALNLIHRPLSLELVITPRSEYLHLAISQARHKICVNISLTSPKFAMYRQPAPPVYCSTHISVWCWLAGWLVGWVAAPAAPCCCQASELSRDVTYDITTGTVIPAFPMLT